MARKRIGGPAKPVFLVDGDGEVVGALSTTITQVTLPDTIHNGQVDVAVAGTAQPLSATSVELTSGVTVTALSGNGGLAYVGNASVDSSNGNEIAAGSHVFIEIDDLSKVYVDVAVNGEGVSYVAT